jgi:hypothetical protein
VGLVKVVGVSVICSLISAPVFAQDFCADVQVILAAAPVEFSTLQGAAVPASLPDMSIFEGSNLLAGSEVCAISHYQPSNQRTSTGYTCSSLGPDTPAAILDLKSKLQVCLGLTEWTEQAQGGGTGALVASYGLIRFSITRNGSRGLALGVEVFRDERGDVWGSPLRHGQTVGENSRTCTPKKTEEIKALLQMYGSREGAEPFENEQFIGFKNRKNRPTVAFMTKPNHPAHPALIIRDVIDHAGDISLRVAGDFAGDCGAFFALLDQVKEMRPGSQGR